MFLIRKESNEYVENGVYYSCKTIRFLWIKLYVEIFSTTSAVVLQQFDEIPEENSREYHDPTVVKGFIK